MLISAPDFDADKKDRTQRRSVILKTFHQAKKQGDKLVWFIDGETLFEKHERTACTVDGAHPTDLGFDNFIKTYLPRVKKILKKYGIK